MYSKYKTYIFRSKKLQVFSDFLKSKITTYISNQKIESIF